MDMVIRFKDEEGKHRIVTVSKLEIEGVYNTTVKNNVWTFKDSICTECMHQRICEDATPEKETCEWYKEKM